MASALFLTVSASALAAAIALLFGGGVAYLLARWEFPGKPLVASLCLLPMAIPPTATGFLLLQLFAANSPFGGLDLLLTRTAVVLAGTVMAFPLVVRTCRVAFEGIDQRYEGVARTLGLTPLQVFRTVTLPLARRGLVAAYILGFVRAFGEFGATITIAGNIPGRTQTLAGAIYSAQHGGRDAEALALLVVSLLIGGAAILATELLARKGTP